MKMNAKYCENCAELLHEDKYHCPTCYRDDLAKREISGYGKVYSYTTVHVPPAKLAHLAPYTIILVDMDEGLRVTARYEGEAVRIGKKVKFKGAQDKAYLFSGVEK
jgi:uncharacterized OB-fold protein